MAMQIVEDMEEHKVTVKLQNGLYKKMMHKIIDNGLTIQNYLENLIEKDVKKSKK